MISSCPLEMACFYISKGNKNAAGWSSLRQPLKILRDILIGIPIGIQIVGGENNSTTLIAPLHPTAPILRLAQTLAMKRGLGVRKSLTLNPLDDLICIRIYIWFHHAYKLAFLINHEFLEIPGDRSIHHTVFCF